MGKAYSNDFRNLVIKKSIGGMSSEEIVSFFEIGYDTLTRWLRQYRKTGSVAPQKRGRYRPRKLDDNKLSNYVKLHPDETLEEMASYFQVTKSAIWKRLKILGITRKKKTTIYREKNELERALFQKMLEPFKPSSLIYLDESGIDPSLHRDYGRAPRGTQVFGEIKGQKSPRINLIAAQCENTLLAPYVFEGSTDAKRFNGWLQKCLVPSLKPKSLILMDNYSIHKTKQTKNIIEAAKCQLLYLPKYSPDLNPIEKTWGWIKARIKKVSHQFENLNDAIDYVFQKN